MMRNALRFGLVAVIAVILAGAAATWLGGGAIVSCPLPNGASVTSGLDYAPPSLVQALTERIGEVVPAGTKFDTTDVVETGKNRRLIFIWNMGSRWVVATERGGRAYNDPIFAFDLSDDGRKATFAQERVAFPDTVCSTASSLLRVAHPDL
jgi:hypothetical protein